VLLHAGVGDRTMWSEQLEKLGAAGYRAVAPDLPGFGEAPIGEEPWCDVLATMDSLGIERASVVGNSWGAAVALRVAVTAPERVAGLVLVSSPPEGVDPSPELQAAWDEEMAAFERQDLDGAVEAVLKAWTLPDAPAALRERVARMQRHTLELELGRGQAAEDEAPDPLEPFPQSVANLGVPALLLVGEHEMSDFLAMGERLQAALPRTRLEVIAGAGHLAPLETPDEFRRLLFEFLERRA
jgi:3-oxoadipate enol-lactonase